MLCLHICKRSIDFVAELRPNVLQIFAEIANDFRLVFLKVDLLLIIRRFQDALDAEELAASLADQLDLLAVVLRAHWNLMELQSLLRHQ